MGKYKEIIVLAICAALVALSYVFVVRWDLTDDKHYSLSAASKAMLKQTDAPIEVTLLLDGDLNAGFRRLKKSTEETIEEMSVYAKISNLQSPISNRIADSLGLSPIIIHEREQNGKTAQTTVYPYALMSYKGRRAVVTLLKNTRGLSGEENLNAIKEFQRRWAEVGFVPMAEKERLQKEFRGEIDRIFEQLKISAREAEETAYRERLRNGKDASDEAREEWDELEKSVVSHIADNVTVSIRNYDVEMMIYKKLGQ